MREHNINNTKIIVHTDNYENGLLESITSNVLDIFDTIHLMPDTHIGKSVPIGFVAKYDDKIIPDIVGVDIGCGVTTITFNKTELDIDKDKLLELDKFIRNRIAPTTRRDVIDSEVYNLLSKLSFNLKDKDYHALQLATLGGGNHFIEINEDDENYYLNVHSGSRYLGQVVHRHHTKYIKFFEKAYVNAKRELIDVLKAEGREDEINDALKTISKDDFERKYLCGELLYNYLNDVDVCVTYAKISRKYMLEEIVKFLEINNCNELIDTTHNYIDLDNKVIHKGSISAQKGDKVVIPINMRDGIIIGTGKGCSEWLSSAPHGAGRILSRTQAKNTLSMDTYQEQMKDVITFSVSDNTLDEAPDSYRNVEEIKSAITETIEILSIAKSIYNFKNPN